MSKAVSFLMIYFICLLSFYLFMKEVKVGFLFFILLSSCNLANFCLKPVFAGLCTSVLKILALSEAKMERRKAA